MEIKPVLEIGHQVAPVTSNSPGGSAIVNYPSQGHLTESRLDQCYMTLTTRWHVLLATHQVAVQLSTQIY